MDAFSHGKKEDMFEKVIYRYLSLKKLIFTSKTLSILYTNNISIGLFLITLDFIIGSLYLLMILIIHGM
jgi:hypothetical protein